jgi:hypothetical protein
MKAYYVRYALTKGVRLIRGKPLERDPSYFRYECERRDGATIYCLAHPREWFVMWPDAVAKMEDMRARAVKCAEVQLEKLKTKKWVRPND